MQTIDIGQSTPNLKVRESRSISDPYPIEGTRSRVSQVDLETFSRSYSERLK